MSRWTWAGAALTLLVVLRVALWGVPSAVDGALEQAAAREARAQEAGYVLATPAERDALLREAEAAGQPPPKVLVRFRTEGQVLSMANRGRLAWAGGVLVLLVASLFAQGRSRGEGLAAWALAPAVAVATGIGMVVHWGYADPLHSADALFPGPGYGAGVALGCLLAAAVWVGPMVARLDPAPLLVRARWLLGGGALLVMLLLGLFGREVNGARIALWGVQPIELAKLAFVLFAGVEMGRRLPQLRWQRTWWKRFNVPRPRLLAGVLAVQAVLFVLLFLVNDLGPTLILSLAFLALYYVTTHRLVEIGLGALALGLLLGAMALLAPDLLPDTVRTRIAMLVDPWTNGLPGGDQVARAFWAMGAGALRGQGPGHAAVGLLPAGHTDLVLAHLGEVGGFVGMAAWLVAFFALLLQGLHIGARNRTPERGLVAIAVCALLLAQFVVIFGGTMGLLPLTGVVVPMLSFGKTSAVVFLAAVGLLGALAWDGRRRAELDELRELEVAGMRLSRVTLLVGLAALVIAFRHTALAFRVNNQPVLTVQGDGTVVLKTDPRVLALAARIPRGEIRDREGRPIAGTDARGRRTWPLGSAMGTLLGPIRGVHLPDWALEGRFDPILRGIGLAEQALSVHFERLPPSPGDDGAPRTRILLVSHADHVVPEEKQEALARMSPGGRWGWTRLARRDYREVVRLLRMRPEAREEALQEIIDRIDERSVTLSVDARLQQVAAHALEEVVGDRFPAGAAVVIDVDTGQVLARAQVPDFDPAHPEEVIRGVRENDPVILGSYGPWVDKTGRLGHYQAGSVFKLYTALAWAAVQDRDRDLEVDGSRCRATSEQTFRCTEIDQGLPFFKLPEWRRGIHDAHRTPDGPAVDLARAIQVSCNVTFAQIGLLLGPEPLVALREAGVAVDEGVDWDPGPAGSFRLASTAYGQGAARFNVLEAARLVAAIGSGGTYRRCPDDMRLDAECAETEVVSDARRLEPILAGMARVIDAGTARSFKELEGVRVYAKTGTATDPGRSDEAPYGFEPGSRNLRPHSWFVALAEAAEGEAPCDPERRGRLAVAVVIPRGGYGSGPALQVTRRILAGARELGYLGGGAP